MVEYDTAESGALKSDAHPGSDLVRSAATALQQTQGWAGLSDERLRVRAVKAGRDYDVPELLALLTAYLRSEGTSGLLTSPRTVEAYTLGARQFLAWAQDSGVELLRPGRRVGSGFVAAQLAAGRAPAGVQLKVASASALYRALRWAGATDADPFKDVSVPRDPTPGIVKRPPYRDEELADVAQKTDVHTRLLLLLIAHAGLRITEALALEWSDLDVPKRQLLVRSGKGRKGRVVAMSTSLAVSIGRYRALYGPGGPEFRPRRRTTAPERIFRYQTTPTARYHLEKAFQVAGVEFRGFHPGRKYAGTRLLRQIRDFGRVAAHLGHESIDTTRKGYAQLAADDLKDDLAGW